MKFDETRIEGRVGSEAALRAHEGTGEEPANNRARCGIAAVTAACGVGAMDVLRVIGKPFGAGYIPGSERGGPGRSADGPADRRARARVNPQLAGALDALTGDAAPADRRDPMPFDGPDRLAYWQGKRVTEQYAERQAELAGKGPGRRPTARVRGYPVGVPKTRSSARGFAKGANGSPQALPRPARGAVMRQLAPPARAGGTGETEAATESGTRTGPRTGAGG